ncbi:MAG: methylated-DNA--[protein]-cysteine S-methyltransferase [Acidobacteria bacterium]|nr:methylated-DNA--[protein]-cysteine S-methyltransferase [Acidobacteriota bacterium]
MLLRVSHKTPLGQLHIIADEHVVLASGFGEVENLINRLEENDRLREISKVSKISMISDLVSDYFDGELTAFDSISVRQAGATFSQAAWKAMRKIKAGKVITYADLAKRAGSPEAVRAAGTACAKNLIAPIIPCHRIVKTGGALGNYGYGLDSKEWLLRHEGFLQ